MKGSFPEFGLPLLVVVFSFFFSVFAGFEEEEKEERCEVRGGGNGKGVS